MNIIIKSINVNGKRLSIMKAIHWNAGSCLWQNKLTVIEALLLQKRPDVCFISEANLWDQVTEHDRDIPGYFMFLPNTFKLLKHAGIVCLVRENLNAHVMRKHMDSYTATIWLKLGSGKSAVVIAGIYREHAQLGVETRADPWLERQREQERCWDKIVNRWRNIGRTNRCFILGDINLDFNRWSNPEQHLDNMVEVTKEVIEMSGFEQLITGITRQWRGQEDSLPEIFWTNCGHHVVCHFNESRGSSDHNVIGVDISVKQVMTGGNNVINPFNATPIWLHSLLWPAIYNT